jgi:hypothetical protein
MDKVYTARILPAEYESFRRFLHNDLPDTFDEWTKLTRRRFQCLQRFPQKLARSRFARLSRHSLAAED